MMASSVKFHKTNMALKMPKWATLMPKWATQMLKLACCLRFVARKSGSFNAKTILFAFSCKNKFQR